MRAVKWRNEDLTKMKGWLSKQEGTGEDRQKKAERYYLSAPITYPSASLFSLVKASTARMKASAFGRSTSTKDASQ